MSTVKSRGVDTNNSNNQKGDVVSIQRLINSGEHVVTSKGELVVKEPTLEQVIELLAHIVPLANILKSEDSKNANFLLELASKPEVKEALRKVAASLANVKEDFFIDLGITDWLKVFVAVKKVVNWEELSELFSQLNLNELLSQIQ
jgi:hypothetical protein